MIRLIRPSIVIGQLHNASVHRHVPRGVEVPVVRRHIPRGINILNVIGH